MAKPTTIERFTAKIEVNPETGCWEWTASRDKGGYGQFRDVPRHTVRAHRWAYEHFIGPIPDGLQLDHLCRVRHCVCPHHLEPVTPSENMQRGFWATKTHCPQGHPYNTWNTYITSRGSRKCRTCTLEQNRLRAQRKKLR